MDAQKNDPIISSAVDERSFDRYWSVDAFSTSPVYGSSATWKLELEENEFVNVKVRTPQGNFGEEVKKIPKDEAICRFCFNVYRHNMLQKKCKCKFSMIHRTCEVEWTKKHGNNKCEVCEQDIENIPITVSWDPLSSTTRTCKKELIKSKKRFWINYFCFRS
ncbi:hypothetical protein ABFS82_07G068400 [Erythranthe guttata]